MVEGGRPRSLRADHDRRDPLRPRGRAPDRRRADRRSSAAGRLPASRHWQAPEAYPASVFAEVRRAVGGADDGGPDAAGEDRVLRRDQGGQEGRRRRWSPRTEPEKRKQVAKRADDLVKVLTRETILARASASTAARFDEIRPITCEVGVLPRTHGSALFTRGETQALVTATLGTSDDAQIIEEFEGESEHTFLLHYNFPPFSVGETKFMRGPSPPRDRPRQPRPPVALPDAPRRGGVPLHDPRRLRHPRVQRLLLDGDGLRRHARPHGRGRADQGAGRGRRDGPRRRRRRASPS